MTNLTTNTSSGYTNRLLGTAIIYRMTLKRAQQHACLYMQTRLINNNVNVHILDDDNRESLFYLVPKTKQAFIVAQMHNSLFKDHLGFHKT